MSKTIRIVFVSLLISVAALAACTKTDAPASAAEAYWKAMAVKDSNTLSNLSCKDYEAQALSTLDSFSAVDLTLKDIHCTTGANDGTNADVTCKGSLDASYGSEDSSFDLSISTYQMVLDNGNWLMCGEK